MVKKQYLDMCPNDLREFASACVSNRHIIFNSKLPFIRFDLLIDCNLLSEMHHELKKLKDSFFSQPGVPLSKAKGVLIKHFLYRNKFEDYRSDPDLSAPLIWSDDTPSIVKNFFSNILGDIVYSRIQCDLLLPGGYIGVHADTHPIHNGLPGQLVSLNIAITHPAGCYFYLQNYGHIPFKKPGDAFLIDTCIPHCVVNDSSEDRYHFKVHIDFSKSKFNDEKILKRSYFKTLGTVSNLDLIQ